MANKKQVEEMVDSLDQENLLDKEETQIETKAIRIGDKTTVKKVNKFDLFFISIWSFICSAIIKLSSWICKGIKFVFKKEVPQKYVIAVVATILIILLIALITAPFKVNVTKTETLELYSSNLIAVQKYVGVDKYNNPSYKWGYANKNGDIKINCQYEEAMDFRYKVAFVKLLKESNGTSYYYWTRINTKGKPVSDLEITVTGECPVQQFSSDTKLARIMLSGKYGYINTKGKIKIDTIYDNAGMFIDGVARVQEGGNVYFINSKGKQVSDNYQNARDMVEERAAVQQRDSGKWGFVNNKGELVIKTSWDEVSDFYNGYAAVRQGETYGVIDSKGNVVVKVGLFKNLNILEYFN